MHQIALDNFSTFHLLQYYWEIDNSKLQAAKGDLVCVEHDVGVAVFVLPLLNDLLVDEVPLRHGPAVLADVLAQLRDRVVLAGVVAPGRAVVLGNNYY